jgi:hypothetical protein
VVLAAADASFLERLKRDRSKAALQAGIALTPAEQAVLDAIPPSQLEVMARNLPEVVYPELGSISESQFFGGVRPELSRGTRPGIPIALAAGAVIAGGACVAVLATHGVRPGVAAPLAPPPGLVSPPPSGEGPDMLEGGADGSCDASDAQKRR